MKKTKTKNTSKTRVRRPDLGPTGDTKYYASSSSTFGQCMRPKNLREAYFRPIYNAAKAQRATASLPDVSTWPLGSESLNWSVANDRLRWSNCTHVSVKSVQHPYGRICLDWRYDEGPYSTESLEPYWRQAASGLSYWRDAANTALSHSLADEQLFSARAYWSMRPKFQSDVSLINSIFELKDFEDVAKYLFSPKGLLRSLVKAYRSPFNVALGQGHAGMYKQHKFIQDCVRKYKGTLYNWLSHPGSTIGDIVEHASGLAANGVLTYNLAYLPTVRDAISIHAEAQKDVFELARNFKKMGEEGARSHYSENTVLLNTLKFGTYNASLWGTGKYIHQTRSAMAVNYYKTLWSRFEDAYPKWWGLEIGADEIWNMLPLSFVWDYVLTVGKSLEYMDVDKNIDVHHVDYLESVKTLATSGIHYLHNARTSHLIIADQYIEPRSKGRCLLVTGTEGKYYQRRVKEPYKGPALPKLKAPSATQAVNLAALVRCLIF